MTNTLDDVMASFHRCRKDQAFIDTFYDLFLNKSPEIADKFRNTDFNIQRLMLRESLLVMLCFNLGVTGTREELVRMGRRHSRSQLDIRPELYDLWLDALCETIKLCDSEYSPGLEAAWRREMQAGINIFREEYDQH